ncbi:hypothetical protein Tco_0811182 [Tanacetum coccineum]
MCMFALTVSIVDTVLTIRRPWLILMSEAKCKMNFIPVRQTKVGELVDKPLARLIITLKVVMKNKRMKIRLVIATNGTLVAKSSTPRLFQLSDGPLKTAYILLATAH